MPTLARIEKPKTRAGKRFLVNREPKIDENSKNTIFIRGKTASAVVVSAVKDLYTLKKQNSKFFGQKNDFLPFENSVQVEQFAQKSDASLFAFASHNKKRPHNIVFGRTYDGQVLDMAEFAVDNFVPMAEFKTAKIALGTKPMLVFNGEHFENEANYKRFQSLFTDFFRGPKVDAIRLQGLEHVIQFTATAGKINFRSYRVMLKKSGTRTPRIELVEIGPRMDLIVRRNKLASDSLFRLACKQPYQLKPKPKKNIKKTALGHKMGKIHMERQDYKKLSTKKFKGLRKSSKTSRIPIATNNTSTDASMDVE